MSFWAGTVLKRSVVMAADTRRVYPDKGSFEDGRSNLVQVSEHTWLAAAGFYPLAGLVLEGFKRVFPEGKVDLTLWTESEAAFRGALMEAYSKLAEGSETAAADLLVGGVSTTDDPFLAPLSSRNGFRLRFIREPYATVCVNFAEPLQSQVQETLAPLRKRLAREATDQGRVQAAQAAYRQALDQLATGSKWVGREAELVVISPKGSKLTAFKVEP